MIQESLSGAEKDVPSQIVGAGKGREAGLQGLLLATLCVNTKNRSVSTANQNKLKPGKIISL